MVRMGAITPSLEMSSQVGATAGRKMPAASANSSASRIQVAKAEPDLAVLDFAGRACGDRLQQAGYGLKGAESHDKHGAPLDDRRNVETRAQAPQGGAGA
jgi:hypothetical protein